MTTEAAPIVLDAAQLAGVSTIDNAVAQALRNLAQAKVQQARIYAAVGLDPDKRYVINQQTGEVTEKEPNGGHS